MKFIPYRYLRLGLELSLVIAISSFICIWRIGESSFGEGDQTTHAKVTQEMVYSGRWWHPTHYGGNYFNKPPFKIWLSALVVKFFGESNFNYRILDGLVGVGTVVAIFLFGRYLFQSSLAGLLAALALLGCRSYIFGHGVREAVQDSMVVFLTTLALIISWHFVGSAEFVTPNQKRLQYRRATFLGLLIGLSILTKHAAGLVGPAIIGIYTLLSRKLRPMMRNYWGAILLASALILIIPGAYFVFHLVQSPSIYYMMRHEIYKRAVSGYHNRNAPFFYVEQIFSDRLTVPPEILLVGLCWAVFRVWQRRDQRYLFLLCWSVVPVVVLSFAKSRLTWYISASFPGMALLVGATLGSASIYLVQKWRSITFCDRRTQLVFGVTAIFFAVSVIRILAYNLNIVQTIIAPPVVNTAELISKRIIENENGNRVAGKVLTYEAPRITHHEAFYYEMAGLEKVTSREELIDRLSNGEARYVLTSVRNLADIVSVHPITGYFFSPPMYRRRQWLLILSYESSPRLPSQFKPANWLIDLGASSLDVAYGWKQPEVFHGIHVRASKGARSGIILDGDSALNQYGSRGTVRLGSTVVGSHGPIEVTVFLNEERVDEFRLAEQGFTLQEFLVPKGVWMRGKNLLSFRYQSATRAIESDESVIIYDWVLFALGSDLNVASPISVAEIKD